MKRRKKMKRSWSCCSSSLPPSRLQRSRFCPFVRVAGGWLAATAFRFDPGAAACRLVGCSPEIFAGSLQSGENPTVSLSRLRAEHEKSL